MQKLFVKRGSHSRDYGVSAVDKNWIRLSGSVKGKQSHQAA